MTYKHMKRCQYHQLSDKCNQNHNEISTPTGLARITKSDNKKYGEIELSHTADEIVILLLGMYEREMKTHTHTETCI